MSDASGPEAAYPPEAAEECEAVLGELIGLVERAKSMPLSTSAIVSRDEILGLLARARELLPAELARARRVLQDRDEVRSRAMLEADELLDEARAQAAHLVQRTEVVRQARHQADRILVEAEADARRIRHDADDYVDRKLASFEVVLDRTMRTVRAGRERLSVVPAEEDELEPLLGEGPARGEDGFFDQDRF